MPILSIVIPTYNRADKLLRVLKNIEAEISDANINDPIHILISDNGSSDDTQLKVSQFKTKRFKLSYFRQAQNLGFDGNVRFLYNNADADYVWLFADDDILLPGAIATVINGLKLTEPDVLLFSFIQPPESKSRTFDLPEKFSVITEPKEMIRHVARYPKLSIYVFRKIDFSEAQKGELEPFFGNGYYFVDLCYSVLSVARNPRLCIISEPLAICDDDYINITYGAQVFLGMYNIFNHPFVRAYLPNMAEENRIPCYYSAIQLMFSVKMGSIIPKDPALFEEEIRSYAFMPHLLLRNPRALMQLILLKIRLVWFYKKYKKYFDIFKKSTLRTSLDN